MALLGDLPRLYVFRSPWDEASSTFSLMLRRELGEKLIGVIVNPKEDLHVYGANILVVWLRIVLS